MLITQVPLLQVHKNGKLLPTTQRQVPQGNEQGAETSYGPERETYVFSVDDKRRITFRKWLDDHGIPYNEISTHIYRKGSVSHTASGSTAAPPIVVICLRAGWKLGGVLNT